MATALSSWFMVDVCRETTETTIRSLLHPHSQVIRPPISFVLGVCSGSKRCQVFAVKSKRSTCDGWATNVHKLYCHTILALMGFEPKLLSEHRLFITQIMSINIKTQLQIPADASASPQAWDPELHQSAGHGNGIEILMEHHPKNGGL